MILAITAATLALAAPVKVEVKETAEGWQLMRGGRPYYIKGVGGTSRMDELVALGGNSMRSWGDDRAATELDECQKRGLTLTVGIWLGHRSYFDYSNPQQVKEQYERVRASLERHRNHPAVLMWGLGNEMELDNNNTPTLWKAIEDLAQLAHRLDPNHPAMTVVAEVTKEKIDLIKKYAPSIDVLGINSYGGLESLPKRLKEYCWTKPYVITEFGPMGPWEVAKTPWGAALEPTSTEKAALYARNYQNSIAAQPKCLGSYAFLWGHKQEETPTWFGMFLPSGERTGAVEMISHGWTGKWPEVRAPVIQGVDVAFAGKDVRSGEELGARASATDPSGRPLRYTWTIMSEVGEKKYAGEGEAKPVVITEAFPSAPAIRFSAPKESGKYRLYLKVSNDRGAAATANAPFRVIAAD